LPLPYAVLVCLSFAASFLSLALLGSLWAGKGTQCARIVDRFGFVHLSAGDLLRAEREKGGETGEMIDRLIREGQIVPVKVTLDLLRAAMEDNMKQGRFLFLIDGFPRNQDNLDGWNREMADFAEVDFCLNLDCPEEVMEARLLKRGETSGRTDDNAEAIKKRFVQSTHKRSGSDWMIHEASMYDSHSILCFLFFCLLLLLLLSQLPNVRVFHAARDCYLRSARQEA
jgi:UMP-CMP kinase